PTCRRGRTECPLGSADVSTADRTAAIMARSQTRNCPVVGEVIEAGTTRFTAQCPRERLHAPPAFGAFVNVLPAEASPAAAEGSVLLEEDDPFADPPAPTSRDLPPGTPAGTLYALV